MASGMSTPIRLAIIGCGGMAGRHVRSYEEVAQKAPGLFAIDAVCDVDQARAAALAGRIAAFQARPPAIEAEVARLLSERQLDAVDVVLPHALHHTVVVECLAAGVHVLTEKPLAITIRAGRRMIEAAERAGKILAVAEQWRRTVEARTMHWAINRAGLIGAPRLLYAQSASFSLGLVVGTAWRHDKLAAGGGWVLDGEVHRFDLLRYVLGDVARVCGQIHAFEPTRYHDPETRSDPVPATVEDTASAILTFASGALGTFTWTHSAPGKRFRFQTIYGSEGSLDDEAGLQRADGTRRTPDELRAGFLAAVPEETREQLFPLGMTDAVSVELYDFLAAIRDGRPPEIDGLEALRDMAVSEAIYESSVAGRAVTIAEVLDGRVDAYQRPIDEHWGLL